MPYFPVFLDLQGQPCLVVGGGPVGERKVRGLLTAGARVTVVSPRVTPFLAELARNGQIEWLSREYRSEDVDGRVLVFAASPDRGLNAAIARDCRARGVWVNVADSKEESSFLVPAVVRQGAVQVAISTAGNSPALAAWLKEKIREFVGREYAAWADFLGEIRPALKEKFPEDPQKRSEVLRVLARDEEIFRLVVRGEKKTARERIDRWLSGLSD